MKKSKISILLLFIVMILAISAVSAADTNDTSDSNLKAVDEAPVDEVASEDVGALAATDSNNVLSTGGKSFTELQNYINSSTGAIDLTSNYTRVGNEAPVVINKAITINGNRFTIDGNNNGGIFEIGQGGSVTLNDVILINGNAEKGGAIYNNGVITIVNSEFNNNNASLGGAIYNDGYIILTGSTFKDNNATTGLSIYNNGNLSSSRNTINGPIVNTGEGRIISEIRVTVLDNKVITVNGQSVILNATITDSNNNVINQMGDLFKFTVDGAVVGNINFDPILNIYQCTYTLTNPGIYTVNVTYAGGNNLVISSKDKNLKNIRGTFTDLQNMIATSTGALSLSYNITYNEVVDADNFPNGVLINKAITIDGKGYTISGNNANRIFNVTGNNVVIRNVTLTKGKAPNGGAIYTTGNITVDKSNFINNTATNGATYGDAIYVDSGNITISGSTFNEDDAVYNKGNASIKNSDFTSDKLGAIYNSGTLALEGNSVKAIKNSASGKITSEINVLVLEGTTTVYVDGPNVKLYANVTDDNNNPIYQSEDVFKFIIDNKNIVAEFNESSLLYEAVYKFTSFGQYDVNMSYTGTAPNVIITNGTINYITGTFTDLKRLIDDTTNGGTLVLPYDFTYNPAFDGTKFPEGIVIDKVITINGKGHTISGNNSNRIFRISGVDTVVNLRNITFADGNATKCSGPISEPGKCGGAIYSTAKQLTVEDSIFDHNTVSGTSPGLASAGGAIMVESNETAITLTIKNVKFTNNIVENAGGAIHIDGAKQKINYYIYDSLFENNAAIDPFTGSVSTAAGGALYSAYSATGVINNTVFKGNKAESDWYPNGGAIKVEKGSTLTVANSTFEGNNGTYAGGAISIMAYENKEVSLTVDTCKFISNVAENPIVILSNGNQVAATVTITNSNFTEDNAVRLDKLTTATISNSVFTSTKDSAIVNYGTLALAGNKVETILNYGTITSQVNATVLNNETRVTKDDKYNLTAIVTDDNGNLIKDTRLKFVVNDQTITTEPTYDSGVYKYADYPITMDKGEYIVGVNLTSATNLVVKTGTIKNLRVGTFTDLERLINNTTAGQTLVLPYDFTYSGDIDGTKFPNGIVINKAITIDGKGKTISGNNSNRIFIINASVTIKNTVFADVNEYAIKNNATLTLENNTISKTQALIINNGNISTAVVKVLENKTVDLKFAQNVTLNATFTDDKGNWILDDDFAFTLTNVASPITATYNPTTGLYTAKYTADKVETKTVSVDKIGTVAQLVTGTLEISPASVVITITANATIERKQNESITVTLEDEFGNPLSLKLTVFIRNSTDEDVKTYTPTTTAGVWSVEVPGLAIDNYTIYVNFGGNDNYSTNFKTATFEVVELNITNTFTELQRLIEAYEGTGNVLVLPHNFKYNDYVDEDFYANGVLITKDIVIDGNGTTIDSDNVYRIFNITAGVNVTIKNVTLINGHASADDGAAIFTNADSLTIDSCNFLNGNSTDGGAIYIAGGNVTITDAKFINNTAYMGGAIFVAVGANLTVDGATFDNNTAPHSGAIRVGLGAFLTLSNSKFTNNLDDFNSTIGNLGTLALDSNDVDGTIYNGGKITTPVYSTVLGNGTYDIVPTLVLTADLKDANGNLIYDPEFKFVVNDQTIDADYNATTGIYNATFNTASTVRVYVVNATSANEDNLITKISIFTNITGTFTDLQNLIDNTTAGNTLELPYDFAYVALIDGDKFPEGVVINKAITIDGKEHTISGSNSNRIFKVAAATTLNNVSLVNGNTSTSSYGGAIYATADLNVYNSTFDSNVATIGNGGAILIETKTASLTLNIKNVNFTNNKADHGGAAIGIIGASGNNVNYNIYDSVFENNVAIGNGISAAGGALWVLGNTQGLINNTVFKGNKAETGDNANGGAILLQNGGSLTVANSTFDGNIANATGGAISIQAENSRLDVVNCNFTNNAAEFGSAIGTTGSSGLSYVSIIKSKFAENTAVCLDANTDATIKNSEFTSAENYAITNYGTLELSGNTVKVIFNNGTIESQVNSTVLQNKTYDVAGSPIYNLNASLVDDKNNKIYDPNFRFVINGKTIAAVPDYDSAKGEYTYTLDITTGRVYVVDVVNAKLQKLSTKTSIVRNITGTFTDLQKQINAAAVGGNRLTLPYNFTYTPEIDEDLFYEGVLISDKITINGNGSAIIGDNNERIFNVTAKEVVLNNIKVVNGSFNSEGAAIYVADGADLTINKGIFEHNIGDRGAVYVDNGGKLTVRDSTFSEDRAIMNNGTATIRNSKFTTGEIFAIYNNGTLELDNNTVTLIYNGGTITSEVIATFIEGKTIPAELGDKVSPNATLTDGNGNPIFDDRFIITVKTTALETDYDESSYVYTANYTIVKAGENIVSGIYPTGIYPTITINNGIYDVPKANVTEFTITVGDLEGRVAFGENATMIITLLGVNGTGLTETIGVIVNDTNIPVKVVNGVAIVNISGLAPGKYAAVGYFTDNDNYNNAYATGPFTVLQPTAILNVTVEDITYGDAVIVNISLTDNETGNPIPYNTTVRIVIAGTETVVIFKDGEASVEIPYSFAANEDGYLVNVTFVGDVNYDPVTNDTEIFKVSKASIGQITIIASALEVEAFDIVTFDFTIPIEGEYLIYENDKHQTVRLAAGEFRTSANFTVGNYTIKIVYPANQNYTEAVSNEINITVKPKVINPDSVIVLVEGNYNDPLEITLWAPVDGKYLIDLGTGENRTISVKDGIGNLTIKMLRAGNYSYTVNIVDGNYSLTPVEGTFKYKALPSFTVNITGTYPTATITISGSNGTYTVYVDNKTYEVVVKGTEASAPISFITAGGHVATVELAESDDYYYGVIPYYEFTIAQANLTVEPEVIGELIVDGPINITFKLPTDINASNVAALIDGVPVEELPVNETTGVYTLVFDGFTAGDHAFTVNVNDPNYVFTFAVKEFFIEKHNSTMETTVTPGDITYGDNVTVTVNVGVNATKFVAIDVNGKIFTVDLVNGVATKEIAGLDAGNYTVTVTYGGDDKYNPATGSAKFTINKAESKVTIDQPIANVTYGNPVEIAFNIVNETSFVTINVVDVNDPQKQIKFVTGETSITINDLAVGTYNITIHNGEDGNYKESEATAIFNVVKNATVVTIAEEINATIRDDVVVEYNILPAGVNNGNITLWINGNEYYNNIITEASGSIRILSQYLPDAGTYNITVQYRGNDNYTESNIAKLVLNVAKINVTDAISIEGSQITYGETGTITVEFGNLTNVTGTVNVTFHEIDRIFNATVEDGVAVVYVSGLNGSATYHIKEVVYSGNEYYYGFTVNDERITIEVVPASSSVEINDITDVTYHADVTVTYTVTNKTDVTIVVKDANGVEITKGIDTSVEDTVTISGLGAGKYTITVLNAASDNYNASTATKEFTVLKNSTITVEPVVIGDKVVDAPLNITFTLPTDVNSSYVAAYINGVAYPGEFIINETTGVYTVVFDGFHVADGYGFKVVVNDPNYIETEGEVTFVISKVTPEITISDIAGNVDDTVKVNVTIAGGDATGYIIFNGLSYMVIDGKATIDVVISTPGMQGITVEYTGDDKYFNGTAKKGFIAGKGASTIYFTADVIDEFLDNDVEIEFVVLPYGIDSGNVILWINGEEYDEFAITQSVNSIKILSKYLPTNGTYNVTARYMGNELYNASNIAELVLNITKLNCTIDINVPEGTTSPVFTVTLPEDAQGSLLVDINGVRYYAPIENGTATITVPTLIAGDYPANISYTGDDKYPAVLNITTVNVPSNLPENAISIPSSASTYNPTYGINNLPKDATGTIEVDIDGKKHYAIVQDGKASVSVPGLSVGEHNVTVTYSGDEKYTKISKSATVILTEPVVILVGTNVKYIYSAEGEYKVVVTIDGAPAVGKTVTVNFNGKNYKVVTDSKGYATLKLNTKVKPKKYTVTTTFMGEKAKNKVTIKHLVKAKDAKVKKSKKVNKVKVALKKVDGKYLSGKKITIKFKGKKYKVKTNEKGKAKWKVKSSVLAKLKVGKKYKYSATYGKDKVTAKLKIKA